MNTFYDLYVRFMIWLGAAPPEGYESYLPDTENKITAETSYNPPQIDSITQQESNLSREPSPLSGCAAIGGGWVISIGSGLTLGVILSLVIGFGTNLVVCLFASLPVAQIHPACAGILITGPLLTIFVGLPVGLVLGIIFGIVAGLVNTGYQMIRYENKMIKHQDEANNVMI